jgi:hypothetical protein
MYSVMNEYGQIMGFYMMTTQSLAEISRELALINKRYGDGAGPQVFYTDNCCKDRGILERVFPSLRHGDMEPKRVLLDIFHWMDR